MYSPTFKYGERVAKAGWDFEEPLDRRVIMSQPLMMSFLKPLYNEVITFLLGITL